MSDADPPPMKMFAFVQNNLDVACATPAELIPNHILRRPTDRETERIREGLAYYGGPFGSRLQYESTVKADGNRGGLVSEIFRSG
jgi:hypothetical protein